MDTPAHLWMKPAEAARVLHLHPDTLARKVDAGELQISLQRSAGGRRHYLRSDVAWAASGSPFAHVLLADVAAQIHEIISDVGIALPMNALNDLYKDRYALLGELKEMSCDSATDERICDVVARDLTGCDWPTNGEGERTYREFRQTLEREAAARGWQLTRTPVDQSTQWLDAAGKGRELVPAGQYRLKLTRNRHAEVAHLVIEQGIDADGNEQAYIRTVHNDEAPSLLDLTPKQSEPDLIYCQWRPGPAGS